MDTKSYSTLDVSIPIYFPKSWQLCNSGSSCLTHALLKFFYTFCNKQTTPSLFMPVEK